VTMLGPEALERPMNPHSEHFPDPTATEERLLRVWFVSPPRYLFVSVDNLREARLVLKTVSALTALIGPKFQGLQWYQPDQGWVEWAGADGESIHDLPDTDAVFARPSRARHARH
jgi:hypothetical protein